jgi:hypothetical protein
MTEKEIDRVLRKIKRGKLTYERLVVLCNRIDPTTAGLRRYFKRNYALKDAMGRTKPSPGDLIVLSDEGENRLAEKREVRSGKRWTRGLAIAALVISLGSLVVAIIALLKAQ